MPIPTRRLGNVPGGGGPCLIRVRAIVEIDGETSAIVERSHVHIPLKAVHRVRNNGTVPLVILELQQGDVLDEADIVRLEDDYAR
jgi:mannose-6-phosphate isomerase